MKLQKKLMLLLCALLLGTTTGFAAGNGENCSDITITRALHRWTTAGGSHSIDLGDFFQAASVTIEYNARSKSGEIRTKIGRCTFDEKDGCSKHDIKTAKRLLRTISLNIAANHLPTQGSGSCTIVWKQDSCTGTALPTEVPTIDIKKALEYPFEGSAFLSVETDESGKATKCDYLGGIILHMPFKKPSRIENLNVELLNNNTSIYSMRIMANDYDNEYEQKVRAIHKSIKRNTRPIIESIKNGNYSLPANKQLCIAINISSQDAEPKFPGGSSALREYVGNRIEENEHLKEFGITGHITVEFIIGTDGHPTHVNIKDGDFSRLKSTTPLSKKRIEKITTKAVKEAFGNMPQWQPERADCRIALTLCTMQIEIK